MGTTDFDIEKPSAEELAELIRERNRRFFRQIFDLAAADRPCRNRE